MLSQLLCTVARVAAIVCLAAVMLSGCGKKGDARLSLGPVKGFSLGSAKAKPFTKRPTAKELYERMYTLYSSFDSIAVSQDVRNEAGGHPYIEHDEYRLRSPHKQLHVRSKRWLSAADGEDYIRYHVASNSYHLMGSGRIMWPGDWCPVFPWHAYSRSSVKLLPDSEVGGDPVYVSEEWLIWKDGSSSTRLYVGKRDWP